MQLTDLLSCDKIKDYFRVMIKHDNDQTLEFLDRNVCRYVKFAIYPLVDHNDVITRMDCILKLNVY